MQVLTAAIGWQAFRSVEPELHPSPSAQDASTQRNAMNSAKLRERLLKIMIMELGSPHDSIVEVAKIGVLQALEHNMLPKPILQEALRPILTDLAYYYRINLRLLRHLHRLLDLLSGQFNVTLGEKLSEHLKKWIDVNNILQPTQPVSWAPGTECEVAAGMLDIFHKLPSQARKFLETHGNAMLEAIFVKQCSCDDICGLPRMPLRTIATCSCRRQAWTRGTDNWVRRGIAKASWLCCPLQTVVPISATPRALFESLSNRQCGLLH
jgi:hypothetical protein